jgi:hypothetical protein
MTQIMNERNSYCFVTRLVVELLMLVVQDLMVLLLTPGLETEIVVCFQLLCGWKEMITRRKVLTTELVAGFCGDEKSRNPVEGPKIE